MSEDQRITKSFDFAADVTKQLIALSTAIISLCVAFTDKIFSSSAAQSHSTALLIALLLFVASIIFGIITLMALAGHLGKPQNKTTDLQPLQEGQPVNPQPNQQANSQTTQSPIYNGNVRFFSMGQMTLFVAAIIVAMVYVWKASSTPIETSSPAKETEKYLKVIRVSDYSIENSCVTDTLCLDPRPNQ